MSGRIDFRAWNHDEECMLDFGCLCQTAFNGLNVNDAHRQTAYYEGLMYKVATGANYTRMLWTGIRDQKDEKIYHGDVVKVRSHKFDYVCVVAWWRPRAGFVFTTGPLPSIEGGMTFFPENLRRDTAGEDWLRILGNVLEDPNLIRDGYRLAFPPEQ